ncbi:MAG: T9SS type A sorting domain-containing protein [Candidatus Cloacimonetes bacterium]|nr:T9SS type A sorting domain-containing protein [Candidatus Cloacimonadota bacterium]
MKGAAIVIISLLFSSLLFGQTIWEDNGIPIRQGVNIEWYRSGTSLEDGSVVYVWSDTRLGDRDVWAQRVDINGNLLWGADAVMVNGEINRQEDPVVINTGDGGVIIAWVDFRNEDAGDVYAQKLDGDGNLLWNEAGVPLCLASDVQISLNIVNDANQGAYVIWLDSRNPGGIDIYGTHVNASGDIVTGWDVNGNPIAAENGAQDGHTFWEDGTGGAILAWHDTRVATDENLYMQRIASDGTLLWGAGGTLLCGATDTQSNVKVCPDGTGSFIFTWRDKHSDPNGDIMAMRVDLDANFLWAGDVPIFQDASIQKDPRITQSSDTGAIIVWVDYRNDPLVSDIYTQKINVSGTLLWGVDGIALCTAENNQLEPRLTNDENGGCYFVWTDGRNGGHPHEDIYMQHVSGTGTIEWESNGQVICNAYGEQFSPLLRGDGSGKVYAIWGDNRQGSTGLYFQILNGSGTEYLTENGKLIYYGLCGDAKNYLLYQGLDKSLILWEDSRSPYTGNQLYMQALNNDGTIDLAVNGAALTGPTGYDQENVDAIYIVSEDELAAVWEENRTGFKQIYAQAVDGQCSHLWLSTGLALGDFVCEQQNPKISAVAGSRTTEYYAGWSDYRDFMDPGIFGQKIVDGVLQWNDEGIEIVNRSGEDKLTDVVGLYYIFQSGAWNNQNIYVKKIDSSGNTATGWSDDGLEICGAANNQNNATGLLVPEGLFVIWEDSRDGVLAIYGQVVTESGSVLWQADGVPIASYDNDQSAPAYIYDNDLYAVWEDFRNGVDYNIYGQKVQTSDGSMLWNPDAVPIVDEAGDQTMPSITKVGINLFVPWQDFRNGLNADIYGQKISLDGTDVWTSDLPVCTAIKNQSGPLTVPFDDYYASVIWQDARSSGKADIYNIYAQKVQINETSVDDPQSSNVSLISHYPNPITNSVFFVLKNNVLHRNNRIEIYNLKGQKVYSYDFEKDQIEHIWDTRDLRGNPVANGVYFYRYSNFSESTSQKLIILR